MWFFLLLVEFDWRILFCLNLGCGCGWGCFVSWGRNWLVVIWYLGLGNWVWLDCFWSDRWRIIGLGWYLVWWLVCFCYICCWYCWCEWCDWLLVCWGWEVVCYLGWIVCCDCSVVGFFGWRCVVWLCEFFKNFWIVGLWWFV